MYWRSRSRFARRSSTRLAVEQLEDRCLLSAYSVVDLGSLGGSSAQANDINQAGDVAGTSTNASFHGHGFRWQNGVMTDLGTLGGTQSQATALNNVGQVVGVSQPT